MIVVSDTSPVTNLIGCGLLNLLPDLYGEVVVPQKVRDELAELIRYDPSYDMTSHPWIHVRSARDQREAAELMRKGLDAGEAEAIVLAEELAADLLLIDERKASRIADERGLRHVGVLGILIAAKKRGLVTKVEPIIKTLRDDVGFWLSDDVVQHVLKLAGESRA